MSEQYDPIRDAINTLDIDLARKLLREALKEPTGEVYYLASQVAVNDKQRLQFLQKAIDLDPFHEKAHEEIGSLEKVSSTISISEPSVSITGQKELESEYIPRSINVFSFR